MNDARLEQIERWLAEEVGLAGFSLRPASADASFRRYFRVTLEGGESHIVMDAPPGREDCRPFVTVARALAGFGLQVPEIVALDLEQGFLLLGDLGDTPYLQVLDEASADPLYRDAIDALVTMQARGTLEGAPLPPYDYALLMEEMALFRYWLLERHLGIEPPPWLDATFEWLAGEVLAERRVWVHRDYHSRNLMVTERNNPGILDFQDAVIGPQSYDLVSLLKDCYIAWPRRHVVAWVEYYFERASEAGLCEGLEFGTLLRRFDRMGVQRHLKAAGIFARLNHRDGKPGYLGDIPRTLGYIVEVAHGEPRLAALGELVEERVLPRLAELTPSATC